MEPRRVFYGWVIVGAGILVTCMGLGAMFSLGVFLKPISETMGWSRTGISTVALLNWLGMGLGSFVWGALSDRIGTRAVVLCGGVLLGAGLVTASQAATLGQFQLSFGVLVGFATGSFYAPVTAAATRWFTQNRSLAVALVSSGIGLGTFTIGPLARALINAYDWRLAMLVIGDLCWLVVIPAALLIRPAPADVARQAAASGNVGGREYTAGAALRTPQFWAIALTHFACCAAHSGPIFHMVTHAIDRGVTALTAATVLGVSGMASVTGRVVCGVLADRYGAKPVLIVGLVIQALSVTVYLVTNTAASFYGLALVFGFSYGGVMPLYAILVREYFGERIMGTAYGAVFLVSTLGMALGAWSGGWIFDAFGSYAWLFIGSAGIGAGAVAIALTFRPPGRLGAGLPSPTPAG
ncbi:MAG: MFS transporter [Candidatus Rokubacteria bacterium]|nr:MFS transporter [Candidatus Rokubacteria bacterium]